jgi:glycosyltransferase involved in cell wall biosynthesis
MTVCYFGAYDRTYSRNRILVRGLRMNGVAVVECQSRHPFKPLRLPLLAACYVFRARHADVIVVGASGHMYVPLAKVLGKVTGTPVVFDAFVSQFDTAIRDRTVAPEGSWRAKYFQALDRVSTALADIVIMDTDQDVEYYCRAVGAPRSKFRRILVGAETDLFYPRPERAKEKKKDFLVVFAGTFIPLQGVPYIVRAAHELEHEGDVHVILIGTGQTYPEARQLADDLKVRKLSFRDPVPLEQLPETLAEADVCLGIFGHTEKATRVIPNKVYQALAMGKPVITGDTPAARSLLRHREDAFLVPVADARAIAAAVVELKENPRLRERLGENGRRRFLAAATPEILGRELAGVCRQLVG